MLTQSVDVFINWMINAGAFCQIYIYIWVCFVKPANNIWQTIGNLSRTTSGPEFENHSSIFKVSLQFFLLIQLVTVLSS